MGENTEQYPYHPLKARESTEADPDNEEFEQAYDRWLAENPDAEFEKLPFELYPVLIPKKLVEQTQSNDLKSIRLIKLPSACISFLATEQLASKNEVLPHRLNQYRNDGDIKDNERILLKLWIFNRNKEILYVHIYDSIEGKGVAKEFYQELLPKLAKKTGVRFLTGYNSQDNIDFFISKKHLGRHLITDIKPEYRQFFIPEYQGGNALYTVQFLYPDDIEKYIETPEPNSHESNQ